MLPHQFRDDTPFPRQRNSPKRKGGNEKKQVGRLLLLVLLLLSCISRVQLCVTPTDSSLPGSLSLGFSRQERWTGLPFPSPVHESEK